MWPFGKKKSLPELAVERAPELVRLIEVKWPEYLRQLAADDRQNGFDDPGLETKFFFYANRSTEAIRLAQPAIRDLPDRFFIQVIAAGVIRSGTHSQVEIEKAIGMDVPQHLINFDTQI